MTKPFLFLQAGLLATLLLSTYAAAAPLHQHAAPPAPRLNPAHSVHVAPYAGRPNYAHAAPAFQWGWFGAERYAPVPQRHKGYYGAPMKWSTRRW